MKIAFLSDTHRNKRAVSLALDLIKKEKADVLIHLGDHASDIEDIAGSFPGKVYAVCGNCDFESLYPRERVLKLAGKNIFITHGDRYGVKSDLTSLALKAASIGADIVLFGHTHIKTMEEYNNILLMNPGSITSPSPWSRVGAVGFIDINSDGCLDTKFVNIQL